MDALVSKGCRRRARGSQREMWLRLTASTLRRRQRRRRQRSVLVGVSIVERKAPSPPRLLQTNMFLRTSDGQERWRRRRFGKRRSQAELQKQAAAEGTNHTALPPSPRMQDQVPAAPPSSAPLPASNRGQSAAAAAEAAD